MDQGRSVRQQLATTDDRRREALAKANAARTARARMRARVKSGKLDPAWLLDHRKDDEVVARMPVRQFLCSLPHVGTRTADEMMQELGIPEDRRMRGLGSNQERALREVVQYDGSIGRMRQQVMADMKHRRVATSEALDGVAAHPALRGLRVLDFLAAMPGHTVSSARALMHRMGMSEDVRIVDLGPRQLAHLRDVVARAVIEPGGIAGPGREVKGRHV